MGMVIMRMSFGWSEINFSISLIIALLPWGIRSDMLPCVYGAMRLDAVKISSMSVTKLKYGTLLPWINSRTLWPGRVKSALRVNKIPLSTCQTP